jgi:membrane protease YdiL (CAAX protease family)
MLPTQLPWLFIMLLFLVMSSSGEELGWRGYAMPRLQTLYGSVWASLILGLLWAFWHLPAFWIPGSPQYGLPVPGYVIATIGYTMIYTCIYNGTKGSVLLACLYHGASNLTLTYGNAIFPKIISDLYLSLPALVILVFVVIVLSGSNGFNGGQSLSNNDTAYR